MIIDVEYFSLNEISDNRGNFIKLYSSKWELAQSTNLEESFITTSLKGTTRGMHLQIGDSANLKIVSVISGEIFDVLIDLRHKSKTFKSINQVRLTAGNTFIIPPGVAHGFQSIEESKVLYLSNKSHDPILDQGFDVKSVPIEWPLDFNIQSSRDKSLPTLENFFLSFSKWSNIS
jgi:dTDP-4-dehydrorhamnose 3,5-epimerase